MNLLQGTPWHAYVQPIGWTLVHFLWQGAVIAILLSATLLFLRSRSANARYLAATIALGVMALCPPLTLAVLASRTVPPLPASRSALISMDAAPQGTVTLHSIPSRRLDAPPSGFPPLLPASVQKLAGVNTLLSGLVAVWLIGVLFLSTRLLGGWVRVQVLMRRAAWRIEGPLAARCEALARRMGITRPVVLRASTALQVPAVAGWLRAVILFPASTLSGLPAEQIEALLAHELAHVRRHDYLVNLTQSVIETLLYYHPAVWWVSQRIRIERELCCDDLVVQVLDDRVGYARALTALEQMRGLHAPALAATDGDLLARVRHILGLPSEKIHPARIPFAGTISLLLCLALCAGLFLQLARAGQVFGNTSPIQIAQKQTAGPVPAAPPANIPQRAAERRIFPSDQKEKAPAINPQEAGCGWQSSAIEIDSEGNHPPSQHRKPRSSPLQRLSKSEQARTGSFHPIHLASLKCLECDLSDQKTEMDTGKTYEDKSDLGNGRIERVLEKIGRRMDAISRRLQTKNLTCRQRQRLTARLDALASEMSEKAAGIAEEQVDHVVALAERDVYHTLDHIDVLIRQAQRSALKHKNEDQNMDPPDPPDPPNPPEPDDSANG